ncbi:hypothetical protein QYE76_018007 [Lolium multiflorum]|uniref:Uncharacterized protein n=1 Tax=Lolium multiflorum TaxID=4521 RepID=A0AAD8V8Z3_LOLMU|nr:hypothetical protein QYE76_018007 [Lolium multiflorum]
MLTHSGVWGNNPQDFIKQAQSRYAFHLVAVNIVIIELKWNAQVANHEAVKNGRAKVLVDGEDDDLGQKALPPRPRDHKATKADLTREALALAFTQTLEKMMAENQATMDKRDEKKRLENEAAGAIYLNLTKEVIEVQKMDVEAKMADTEAKLRDTEARRMDA